ncbi:putative MFS-type transporter YcaD [Marinomonas gallaica]|uniref:MFS-type transporter YcaD n=1 Tax=Marinomonas gallaica TaxID=1806667 RepID=A0A1C3JTQ2_9GAMM|nr:MFS transporter [Marinomonas gallaica]SBT18507.1 putative MFS-type transporter YcaD [Marinomonas gallaica]SBT22784.1 putative MFS-type transporter YcaD [Marinomonas gallaica]
MSATLFSLLALFASGFFIYISHGLINVLLPLRLNFEQVSTGNIGLIMSMFSVGLLLGGVFTRRLMTRVGHIRMYTASAALAAISILICYLWFDEWVWAIMRILMGFCIAATNIVSDGWLSERSTSETRSRILATNQIVVLLSMFLGSFVVNLADVTHATLYIIAGLLLCGGVVPIAMGKATAPQVEDTVPMPMLQLIRTSPVGASSVLVCGLVLSSLLSMLSVYADSKGISGVNLSLLVGAAIIGGAALQFPIGYLADRLERRKVILYIVLFSIVCTLLIPTVLGFDFFIASLILISISSGIVSSLYPLGISETFDRLQQNQMSGAIGAIIIIYAAGGIIGPYIIGLVMEHIGIDYFFIALGLIQLVFAFFVVYRSKVRQSIPLDEQESFVPQGAAMGWVSSELDPRIEYVDTSTLSHEVAIAVDIAQLQPKLALKMVSILARSYPEQVLDFAKALASIEGIDVTELYQRLNKYDPNHEHQQELIQTIITNASGSTAELVDLVFKEADYEEVPELTTMITDADPEHSMEIFEAAAESVMEEHPETVVEIAEAYATSAATQLEEMRYADRLAEESELEQNISGMVDYISENTPEHADDIESVIPETLKHKDESPQKDA